MDASIGNNRKRFTASAVSKLFQDMSDDDFGEDDSDRDSDYSLGSPEEREEDANAVEGSTDDSDNEPLLNLTDAWVPVTERYQVPTDIQFTAQNQ